MIDFYFLLNISSFSTSHEIKTAYRKLAQQFHPDRYSGEDAEDKMKILNEAKDILLNEEKRKDYDEQLKSFKNFKQRAEREAQQRAEREAQQRVEREAQQRAEREAQQRAEREAQQRAEREAQRIKYRRKFRFMILIFICLGIGSLFYYIHNYTIYNFSKDKIIVRGEEYAGEEYPSVYIEKQSFKKSNEVITVTLLEKYVANPWKNNPLGYKTKILLNCKKKNFKILDMVWMGRPDPDMYSNYIGQIFKLEPEHIGAMAIYKVYCE